MKKWLMAVLLCIVVASAAIIYVAIKYNGSKPILKIGIFYYVWYNPAWEFSWDTSKIIDQPVLGFYNSSDPVIIRQHLLSMKGLGIDFVVISWWGFYDEYGKFIDDAAKQVFRIAEEMTFENGADNNSIFENEIALNDYGLFIHQSSRNLAFHNNLVDNANQSFVGNSNFTIWDNSCEGNYWSDYNGTDLDRDGVGDIPYVIDSSNLDHYSLMNRYWDPADINHDLRVDLKDVYKTALAYGSYPSHPKWNPYCDINEDETVDLKDYYTVCKSFGEEYSSG